MLDNGVARLECLKVGEVTNHLGGVQGHAPSGEIFICRGMLTTRRRPIVCAEAENLKFIHCFPSRYN